MSKYIKMIDGGSKIIDTRGEIFKVGCCDCGLVHYMGITILDDARVRLQFEQDKYSTAQLRRHNYGELQQGKGNYKITRR